MVDVLIILIIFSTASVLMSSVEETPDWVRGLIFIFSIYLYEPIFITLFGGTIGHHLLKVSIRKVSAPNKKVNIFQASFRFLIKYLLGWISFLTITANQEKRAIHDIISGSIVLFK